MDLIKEIKILQEKADMLDEAMLRIALLSKFCDRWIENGGKPADIAEIKNLIDFYYSANPRIIEEVKEQGFFESAPKKYTGSTVSGVRIKTVRVYSDGKSVAYLASGEEYELGTLKLTDMRESVAEYSADRALTDPDISWSNSALDVSK